MPGSRYVDWLIPGLIGMGIMTNGLWAVAFPIVNARLRKLLKRMMASPMQRWEYLLAQMLARLIFLAPEATLPLAFGSLALGMPIAGSYGADRGRGAGGRAGVRRDGAAARQPGSHHRSRLRAWSTRSSCRCGC